MASAVYAWNRSRPMPMQMIVASRLTDGRVVFLAADGAWVESMDAGLVIDDDERADEWLESAQQAVEDAVVVDPYLIEVDRQDGRLRPTQLREAIRALGPSVGDARKRS